MLKHTIPTIILFGAICSGCGFDFGIDTSPGGTDGGEPEEGTLSCYKPTVSEGGPTDGIVNPEWCHVGWELWPSTYSKDASECTLRHPGFPCSGNWSGEFHDECVLCEPMKLPNSGPYGAAIATSNDGWHMCGIPPHILEPASAIAPGALSNEWPTDINCLYSQIIEPPCPYGFAAVGDRDLNKAIFTCRCLDGMDESCQEGAVCEQGYQIKDGHASPTLCTWDDGSPNGIAPEGPVVYGLDSWADGIIIDGDRITMTTAFWRKATSGAVFDDDQKFGLVGELTHIGPDSLAAHLGFEVGDMLDAEQRDIDALILGEAVELSVIHVDGSERVLTVSVE